MSTVLQAMGDRRSTQTLGGKGMQAKKVRVAEIERIRGTMKNAPERVRMRRMYVSLTRHVISAKTQTVTVMNSEK